MNCWRRNNLTLRPAGQWRRQNGIRNALDSDQYDYSSCIITSAEEGGYVFTSVCLSVCLSVCPSDSWKSCERILTKLLRGVGHGPGTKWLNFGDDLDHRPDPGVRSPKSGFTGLSKKYLVDSDQSCIANLHCKKSFSNTIMLAFGGGLCSLSTSSVHL